MVMFPLSFTFCEIFANNKKMPSLTLKMKINVKEETNGTRAIRLEIIDFILVFFSRILTHWQHIFTQTGNMHTNLHSPCKKRVLTREQNL